MRDDDEYEKNEYDTHEKVSHIPRCHMMDSDRVNITCRSPGVFVLTEVKQFF